MLYLLLFTFQIQTSIFANTTACFIHSSPPILVINYTLKKITEINLAKKAIPNNFNQNLPAE